MSRTLSWASLCMGLLWAGALTLLAVLFGIWRASSPLGFLLFLAVLPLFFYLPGKMLVDAANLRLLPLEHATLSLTVGMVAGSFVYWLTLVLGAPFLFYLWPLLALIVCGCRTWLVQRIPAGESPAVGSVHFALTGLIFLIVLPLVFVPTGFRNLALLPDGGMAVFTEPDAAFHLSFANELTHTAPPDVPFVAGEPLSYHYAMDLAPALFNRSAGLNIVDLAVRFLPTFYLVLTTLAVFCFSRAWLQSGSWALLTTFLVMLAEDFSFVPGGLLHSAGVWSAQYFLVPTTFSLYCNNPMLPALGLLFAGLFCCLKCCREEGGGWIVLTAVLFAAGLEYKVFTSAQALMSLAPAGLLYFIVFRDARLLKVLALTCLLILPLGLAMWQANQTGGKQSLWFHPNLLSKSVVQFSQTGISLVRRVQGLLNGDSPTATGVAALLFVVLPAYLLGSLGLRVLALPGLGKDIFRPTRGSAFRFFLALFVILGVVLGLTCTLAPPHQQKEIHYNNVIWFYVISKGAVWVFTVEALRALIQRRGRIIQALTLAVFVALSVPSTIQFIEVRAQTPLTKMDKNGVELMKFLRKTCRPGAVVLTRSETAVPITALTKCREPMVSFLFADQLVAHNEVARRTEEIAAFWGAWAKFDLRGDLLGRFKADYLVIDRGPGNPAAWPTSWMKGTSAPAPGQTLLQLAFANKAFEVYKICRGAR